MTRITVLVLRGLKLYCMGCCKLPVWHFVKVAEAVFYVKIKCPLINRNMAQGDELFRSILGFQRVEPYFEFYAGWLCLKIRLAVFVLGRVTRKTILIRHGMAGLTTYSVLVVFVNFCVCRFFRIDTFMTINALGAAFNLKSVGILLSIAVHFRAAMALFAVHVLFLPVYIWWNTFV